MANGDCVDWDWVRDHDITAKDTESRLTTVETKVDRAIEDIKTESEERTKMLADDRIERNQMHKENTEKLDKLTARSNILLGIILALQFIIGLVLTLYGILHKGV